MSLLCVRNLRQAGSRIGCLLAVFGLAISCQVAGSRAAEGDWPRWRGEAGDGHLSETNLPPVKWSQDSVVWQVRLPGRGQSSPCVLGDRIFLTSGDDGGRQRLVFCVDRRNGQLIWKKEIAFGGTPEPLHRMNSHASSTCVTDGEVVVAFFGRAGLHAYTVDGQHLWSKDLGTFEGPWGTAACPVIVDNLVIQNGDADRDAFIAGYDKKTGQELWRTRRPDHRGWSTPVLYRTTGRRELVVNGHAGVTAYDPTSGRELWFCKSFNGRGEPTVAPGKELVYLVNGLAGDVYAVRPGGEGDVTTSHMQWHTPRRVGRDLPSPLLIDNYLIVVSMSGVGTCYDAQSGKVLWEGRLGGNYSASPFAANGLAYFLAEDGTTVVLKPGQPCEIVATNTLKPAEEEIFRASPVPSHGQVLIRSDTVLYCIGSAVGQK